MKTTQAHPVANNRRKGKRRHAHARLNRASAPSNRREQEANVLHFERVLFSCLPHLCRMAYIKDSNIQERRGREEKKSEAIKKKREQQENCPNTQPPTKPQIVSSAFTECSS